MKQSEIDAILAKRCHAPDQHHVLTPLPEPDYGRFARGIRYGLLFVAVLWALIFLLAAVINAAVTGGGP